MPVDFAIITIRTDEYYALDQRFEPKPQRYPSGRTYGISQIESHDGKCYTVAIGRTSGQGPNVAQHLAHDMISDLSPTLLLVVGIAGAVPDTDFTLGDVVVSSRIHDFSINAYKPGEIQWDIGGGIHPYVSNITGELPLHHRQLQDWSKPASISVPRPDLDRERFKHFNFDQLTDEDKQNIFEGKPPLPWQKKILGGLKWNFGIPVQRKPDPIFSTGSVASSGSLIRDASILIKWLQTARSIQAFEMEAAGVFQAAAQGQRQYPVMTIRGISDIPGLIRDEAWKRYACHSAAAFTYAFIKAGIVDPVVNVNESWPISPPSITPSDAPVSQTHPPKRQQGDKSNQAVRVYISYSEGDEELKDELGIHLALLQRQGIISSWDNHRIGLGSMQNSTIESYIDTAQIILLLVSPRFIATPQYYEKEVLRAMQRRKSGGVHVVPIILRPVDWRNTLFGQLQPLPRNNKPIVSWKNRDEAWYEIVTELRQLSESIQNGRSDIR